MEGDTGFSASFPEEGTHVVHLLVDNLGVLVLQTGDRESDERSGDRGGT